MIATKRAAAVYNVNSRRHLGKMFSFTHASIYNIIIVNPVKSSIIFEIDEFPVKTLVLERSNTFGNRFPMVLLNAPYLLGIDR